MASASKLLPPRISRLECREIFHPWTQSCFLAYLNMYIFSCIGSGGFFALLYFFQYLVRAFKKKKQLHLKDLLRTYLKSSLLFSSSIASCFLAFSCCLRRILGRFYYYSIVLIPATVAGLAISVETPKNKDFFATTFANLALESWYNKLRGSGALAWTVNEQTLVFMILTSALSYLYKEVQNDHQYFWFFVPPKGTTDDGKENDCFHRGRCSKNILESFSKYFSTGFFLKMLKLVFSNFNRPKVVLSSVLKPKTYKFASFLGFYALLYQSTRCFLYRKDKCHSPLHDVISGFLSGVAYRFEPNMSLFNSAFITILQILTETARRKNILPDLPYRELVFAIAAGQLFHSRFYTPKYCPPLMHYIMSSITYKKSDYVVSQYKKLLMNL